ncbi:hypothetical protein [Gordonia soli]|uniref:Uncharacterized protein n=1 Tax=Gordonia soli NBRC 108243 TaxID=1223545 RepID=M0QS34_9ACTN|nr:hypothetical protein [Gordonia soli]GAC70752.1 hypothetical protein GS4_40_00040 [Gordonia soli NBRC 108243]
MSELQPILPSAEPTAREQAVIDWLMDATFELPHRTIEHERLVGNGAMAAKYAAIMEQHFDANGVDVESLTAWMTDYQRGALLIRHNPAFVPFIAAAIVKAIS